MIGKVLYGLLFCAAIPALLIFWAFQLDQQGLVTTLPPLSDAVGWVVAFTGTVILVWSMYLLVHRGKGLPMNAYPTSRLVQIGSYAVFKHPIYAAFVLVVAGYSLVTQSPSAFWIITPVSALLCISLVVGYEANALRKRLGVSQYRPFLSLPPSDHRQPSFKERMSGLVMSLLVWAAIYSFLSFLPLSEGRIDIRSSWDFQGDIELIWLVIYSSIYLVIVGLPFFSQNRRELRRMIVATWWGCLIGFSSLLMLPFRASYLDASSSPTAEMLIEWNRTLDADWMALPAFHTFWAILFALALSSSRKVMAFPAWGYGLAIALSCIFTGQHALIDVFAGAILALICWHHQPISAKAVQLSEFVSNSWRSYQIGPVRILLSGILSAIATFFGALTVNFILGENQAAIIFWAGTVCVLAAGIWGYFLEGGSRLSRPFGFFGSLIAMLIFMSIYWWISPEEAVSFAAAFAVGGAICQGIGRFRCMMQGCCHGRKTTGQWKICVTNSMSRVVAYEGLKSVPIYPTQLLSFFLNLSIAAILIAFWQYEMALNFICGSYLVLTSLSRFCEEQYRGESQTKFYYGLSIYHWISLGLLIIGIAITMFPSPSADPAFILAENAISSSAILAFMIFLAMGIDFPKLSGPLSRLAPTSASGCSHSELKQTGTD